MKYINYFSTLTATELDSVSWEKMMEVLRSDFLKDNTLKYRALLLQLDQAMATGDATAAESLKNEIRRWCAKSRSRAERTSRASPASRVISWWTSTMCPPTA